MQRTKKLHLFQLLGRDIIWCTLSFNLGTTLHAFFISRTYRSNATLKLTKIKQKLSNTLKLNFCYLKIIHILYPKIIGHILENKQKDNCICIYEIIQLIIMKMKMKMKNRSHRYDTSRPRCRHDHKYSIYRKCLTIMMLTCIKKHLRII